MSRVIPFCVISILLFSLEILSQGNIAFSHLNVEDGLSQSSTTCIFQDKNGFMWFGTQDGLNRYDGYNFKVFKNNPDDATSLSDNFIFSILKTNQVHFLLRPSQEKLISTIRLMNLLKLVSGMKSICIM